MPILAAVRLGRTRVMRGVGFCLVAAGLACTQARSSAPAATASVDYVSLGDGSLKDCGRDTASGLPCRLRTLPRVLGASTTTHPAVTVMGDTITFAVRSTDSVRVIGGLNGTLSRIVGRDEWILSLLVHDADSAIVGYRFMKSSDTQLPPRSEWRGPHAPPPAPRARLLAGILRVDTLVMAEHNERRQVVSYVPQGWNTAPTRHVLYMVDGGEIAVRSTAALSDTLAAMGAIPPIAIVGVAAARRNPEVPGSEFFRAHDYNYGFPGGRGRFLAHERFFVSDLRAWAERTLHVSDAREARTLWGASSGGAFALAMGARHPDLFAHVIAISAELDSVPQAAGGVAPDHFIAAGTFEPRVLAHSTRIADSLAAGGARVRLWRYVGGHDDLPWEDALSRGLQWALGGK